MRKALIAFCLILTTNVPAQEAAKTDKPVVVGKGRHRYTWVDEFGRMPNGKDIGNTHGNIIVDSKDRVYFNTDTERAVCIFSADGKMLGSWGKEFRGGLHGMSIRKEGEDEFIYFAHSGRGEAVKVTLDGKIVWTIGYPAESGKYKNKNQYRPTSVVVGPNKHVYVADGYGRSWIHEFDENRKYVRSFGGPGNQPGQLRTPHGLYVDHRKKKARLLVCDRENNRLQYFDWDGKHLGVVKGMLRRPCNVTQRNGDMVVADLAGRITILDKNDALVAHIGENADPKKWARNNIPREQWVKGQFVSPHGVAFGNNGDLYVMDWVRQGRITHLKRRPTPPPPGK